MERIKKPSAAAMLFLSVLLFLTAGAATDAREKVTLFTVNDGLSQQSVTSIIQDSEDMLWIGTFDGLNLFDGKDFRIFRHNPHDTTSIINNRIISLTHSEEDGLWILFSNNCVGHYLGKRSFRTYPLTGQDGDWGNSICSMKLFDHNLVITGHDRKAIIFSPSGNGDSGRICLLKEFLETLDNRKEFVLSTDSEGEHIWISTNRGIYFSNGESAFEKVKSIKGYSLNITDNGNIVLWKSNDLIVCNPVYNKSDGANLLETRHFEAEHAIQSVSSSKDNELWIGTNNGLYKTQGDNLVTYTYDKPVRIIFNDNLGMTWFGGMNGLGSINPYSQPVNNFKPSEEDFSRNNNINSVRISPDGHEVWFSSKSEGIHLLRFEENEDGATVLTGNQEFLTDEMVNMFYPYSKDTLVYKTRSGIGMMVRDGATFRKSVTIPTRGNSSHPFRTVKMKDGLWISTEHTISRMSIRNGKMSIETMDEINRLLPKNSIIVSMEKDPARPCLWIGFRGDGLYRVDTQRKTISSIEELTGKRLTSDYIWDIHFDSADRLCIGTDAGLNIIRLAGADSTCICSSLTSDDGIANDKIETIEEDLAGNLWLATSQGIVCYNPDKGNIQTFDNEDGFSCNNFTSCSDKMSDGTLFFGSSNGLSYFNPLNFRKYSVSPSMRIHRIIAGSEEVERPDWGKIRLRNDDIRFELRSYYPLNPNKIKYRYSINGDPWITISGNDIILSDLTPNNYRISFSCINDFNISSPVQSIAFKVRRHPLLSNMAMILYALILFITAGLIIRSTMTRKMLDNKLKMEEQLHKTESRMNTEKLNFYTNMAHEIKTPLSLILGRIYDIEHSDEASPYIIRKAKLIGDNAQIIKELTEQILEFKRAISGKLNLQIQEQDILPCIRTIIDNYKDYAEKKGVHIKMETSSDTIIKYIDEKKITRIIYNLLSNAIKFSGKDDVINIKITGKPDCLILTVSDTGQGIDKEDLPHIFERFYKSGKAGGSGIGLAFTKSLVELMNGKITVSSTYGVGTTFQVTIPDHARPEAEPGAEEIPQVQEPEIIPSSNMIPNILLVEDNADLNEYITEILSTRFKVHQCYNGKDALAQLKSSKIDLIISDVMMNGISGIELARKIKNSKSEAHIPIVFLSAKTDPDDQLEGLKTGAVDYITKPFNPHVLLIKIQNILSQYYLSRASFMEGEKGTGEAPTVQNRDEIFINKARDIIYKNMAEEKFGVNALSQEMGISRVHLTREFQRITDQSPSSFIKSIRLNHARHLLSTGEYSIKEVIWEIGIRSHSGFTKVFKEEFGYLPSQINSHRKESREEKVEKNQTHDIHENTETKTSN